MQLPSEEAQERMREAAQRKPTAEGASGVAEKWSLRRSCDILIMPFAILIC